VVTAGRTPAGWGWVHDSEAAANIGSEHNLFGVNAGRYRSGEVYAELGVHSHLGKRPGRRQLLEGFFL
jgi:hypothetical protein